MTTTPGSVSDLSQVTADDVLRASKPYKNVVSIVGIQPLHSVINKFQYNNITAAPVYDQERHSYIGWVDMLEIAEFIVRKLQTSPGVSLTPEAAVLKITELLKHPAREVVGLSGRTVWRAVRHNATLMDLVSVLSQPHARRVLVVDDAMNLTGIITQSRLIEFLEHHRNQFPYIVSRKVREISPFFQGSGRPVHTVNWNTTMLAGLSLLNERQVSALAVVDDHGMLVGAFSGSDIKYMSFTNPTGMYHDLFMPIRQFMTMHSDPTKKHPYAAPNAPNRPHHVPITITPEASLGEVMNALGSKRIHRVFVVDQVNKPIGVVSMSDVLMQFRQ